jgi:hypothetical protein
MPRQPLLKKYPNSGIAFGAGFLEQRPKAAALIGECIAGWTEVELQTARLLSKMLHANTEPAIALYLSLANERAKSDVLTSIAEYVFSGKDLALFNAILKAKNSVGAQRNSLAHGLFGVASDEAEGVAWISTKDRIKHMLEMNKDVGYSRDAADYLKLKEFVSVYTILDLDELLQQIADIHRIMYNFVGYVGNSDAEGYQKLLGEPLVKRSLSLANPKSES